MTRKTRHRLVLATLFILAASVATAGDATLGFDVGYTKPISDNLSDDFNGDLSFMGYGTFPIVGALSLRGEVGRHEVDLDTEVNELCDDLPFNCSGRLRFTNLSGGIQYGGAGGGVLPLDRVRIMPYLYATAGLYLTKGELAVEEFDSFVEQDESYFGFGVGGGLNFRIGETWGIQADVKFDGINVDEAADVRVDSWVFLVTPSAGVWFTF